MPVIRVAICVLALGCVGEADKIEDEPWEGLGVLDLFPLTIGSSWRYLDVDEAGHAEVMPKSIDACGNVTFRDCETGERRDVTTVVQRTADEDEENTHYAAFDTASEIDETGLLRVFQDRLDEWGDISGYETYSPPIVRLLGPPYEPGRTVVHSHLRCRCDTSDRCEQDTVSYRQEVLAMQEVSVEAGTFMSVGFVRTNLSTGEVKHHWYAPGVGRVLEEQIGADGGVESYEALVSYTIGEEPCF